MCTGLEAAIYGASAAPGLGVIQAQNNASKARDAQEAARRNAEATAAANAAGRMKLSRQAMRDNSLLTGGGQGRTTLGV